MIFERDTVFGEIMDLSRLLHIAHYMPIKKTSPPLKPLVLWASVDCCADDIRCDGGEVSATLCGYITVVNGDLRRFASMRGPTSLLEVAESVPGTGVADRCASSGQILLPRFEVLQIVEAAW
jgi:hypothetical protein